MGRRIILWLLSVLMIMAASPASARAVDAHISAGAARATRPLLLPVSGAGLALPGSAAAQIVPLAQHLPASADANLGPSISAHLSRGMFGINVAVWDYTMQDPSTQRALQTLGVGLQQFPNAEDWSWTLNRGRYPSPAFTHWDSFAAAMSLAQWGGLLSATHTAGLYIVNYGANPTWTGGATVAGVRRLTAYIVSHHIPVRAMVIGSEQYGNWVVNLHKDKSAARYAELAKQMADAIHAIAPRMLVGVSLAPPDPSGPAPSDLAWSPANLVWNRTVLTTDASSIQFVSIHDYPIWHAQSNAGLLQSLAIVVPRVATLIREQIARYAGPDARHIQAWITEFSPYNLTPSTQTVEPVYASAVVESLLLWAASGVKEVVWWDLHSDASGTARGAFGTWGLASNGQGPQPAENTLYPSGQAYARLMRVVGSGSLVRVWSRELASRQLFVATLSGSGGRTWVVVNNRSTPQQVELAGRTVTVPGTATRWVTIPQS